MVLPDLSPTPGAVETRAPSLSFSGHGPPCKKVSDAFYHCGGGVWIIASIGDPAVIEKILTARIRFVQRTPHS